MNVKEKRGENGMSGKRCIRVGSRKGFTLIELVVVVAILAVLAAIAIPAVISIIQSASSAALETEAASMDQACKMYYTGVKSGEINRDNFTAAQSGDLIPNKVAPTSTKMGCARRCTVAGALEYGGLSDLLSRLDEFGYDANGNISVLGDPPKSGLTPLKPNGADTFADLNYAN